MSFTVLRPLLKCHSSYKTVFSTETTSVKCLSRHNSNVVYSGQPEVEIPDVTVPEFIFKNFSNFPNKIAVECALTGRKFTYEEVRMKSRNLNRAFRKKLKLGAGSTVAILLPNVPEYPICILGALQAGLKVTTINPLYTPDEIKLQIQDSDAKAIVTTVTLWSSAQAAAALTQNQTPILTIKTQQSESTPGGSINFSEFSDAQLDVEDITAGNGNEVVLLPYSSGTTGLPKGAQHTHRSLIANACQINTPQLRLAQDTTDLHQDIVPGIVGWFHMYGLSVVLLSSLFNMCKLVSLPQFTPELFVNALGRYKSNVLYIVPSIFSFMSNHPAVKEGLFQTVRTVFSAAAPLPATDENKFLEKVGNHVTVLQGYGMTECILTLVTSASAKELFPHSGTVGELVPSSEVKVVSADSVSGDPLAPNQPGELLIKGPQVMKGYHNKLKETEDSFMDGWLRTGDLVYYDNHKMFYVTGRLKEMIKVKAFQVAPAELEEVIRSHPDVSDAGVIGVPHSKYGEVPKACVVVKPNVKVNTKAIGEYVASKVVNYKQIRGGIVVIESIPKNAQGKILRKELKLLCESEDK